MTGRHDACVSPAGPDGCERSAEACAAPCPRESEFHISPLVVTRDDSHGAMSCPLVRMGAPLEEVLSWSGVHSLLRMSPASFRSFPSGSRLVLQLVDRGHICLGVRLKGTRGPAPGGEGRSQTSCSRLQISLCSLSPDAVTSGNVNFCCSL